MKKFYLLFLIAASLCFTQCAEEELFTENSLTTDIQLSSARTQSTTVPEITKVSVNGSKVTIEFTNFGAPRGPEGGFELMIDGKRTYTKVTPRLYSSDKNVKMTFNSSSPNKTYHIYARWNSGYRRSNGMKPGADNTSSSPPPSDDKKDDDSDAGDVKRPSDVTRPVVSKVSFNGSRVTLEFVNFASPRQPEGGFELMIDGKRTGTSIVPRLYSRDKNLKMVFSISNPDDRCYQIYGRWDSGYKGSAKVCEEGGSSSGGGSSPPSDDKDDSDDKKDDNTGDNSGLPSGLPSLKLLKRYEFNSNFGKNVNQSRDGLRIHHLGHTKGKVVREGGEGAYHFRITPGSRSSKNFRQELVPRDLPSPYFRQGFRARWGQEYVFQMRTKLSKNYEIGDGYISFVSMKNDYNVRREGSYTMHFEGDHFFLRHMYATRSGVGSQGATAKPFRYSATGERIYSGRDYHPTRRTGSGYDKLQDDFGKWVTWTFHVKWSYGSNGFFRVYKNGKLFHSYRGPNSYKDGDAPYFKFGLYNSWWKNGNKTGANLQEMYVDYLRVYVPK
ncbi:heparin lyase I family protein [Tunicatimonas pelagia]|uniref:heparin lyase I family protein n=1 Tax=Tunicatimonas pelagia TaxID=931531 RepID=UPI002665D344|nr:heparin lyase I family protein [Tunicatimonas pelagia]WKN40984.1 heparin lyase I family protein [Tunicatimonas pelagia]